MAPEHQKTCTLCSGIHTQMTYPHQWKIEQVLEYVRSLGVCNEDMVSRPCHQCISLTILDIGHRVNLRVQHGEVIHKINDKLVIGT